jgi:2-keto-3-deoxy-L-rhamnonate aldolase RhmA
MTSAVSMKERFRKGPALKAIFSIIPSTHVVEMIGVAGFDAVILDMEHGPYAIDSLIPLISPAGPKFQWHRHRELRRSAPDRPNAPAQSQRFRN